MPTGALVMEVVAAATGECGVGVVPHPRRSQLILLFLLFHSPVQVERRELRIVLGLAMGQVSTETVALMLHPFPPMPRGRSYASVVSPR